MSEETFEVLTALNEQNKLLRQISGQLDTLIKKDHAGSAYQWTPEGHPICPKHGEAMPKREKQGDVWYSHTVTDEHGEVHYCRGYGSKSSPGWEVDSVNGKQDTPADFTRETVNPTLEPPTIQPVEVQRTNQAPRGTTPDEPEEWQKEKDANELDEHFGPRQEDKPKAAPPPQPKKLDEQEARKRFYAAGGDTVKNDLIQPQRFNELMELGKNEGWNKALALLNAEVEQVVNGSPSVEF